MALNDILGFHCGKLIDLPSVDRGENYMIRTRLEVVALRINVSDNSISSDLSFRVYTPDPTDEVDFQTAFRNRSPNTELFSANSYDKKGFLSDISSMQLKYETYAKEFIRRYNRFLKGENNSEVVRNMSYYEYPAVDSFDVIDLITGVAATVAMKNRIYKQ